MGDDGEGDDTTSAVGKGGDDSFATEEEDVIVAVVVGTPVVDDDDEENVGLDDETTSLLETYVGEYVESVGVACVIGLEEVAVDSLPDFVGLEDVVSRLDDVADGLGEAVGTAVNGVIGLDDEDEGDATAAKSNVGT